MSKTECNESRTARTFKKFIIDNCRDFAIAEQITIEYMCDMFVHVMRCARRFNSDEMYNWVVDGEGFDYIYSILENSQYFRDKFRMAIESIEE
jgi:hypothetical protein